MTSYDVEVKRLPADFLVIHSTSSTRKDGVMAASVPDGKAVFSFMYTNARVYEAYEGTNAVILPVFSDD